MDAPVVERERQLPLELPAEQRAAGMRWIIWDGILASSMGSLLGGVFLTGFALLLGATESAIGVLASLPRYSALMQPAGSYFVERLRLRKTISVWGFGPARFVWALVVALPLMGYAGGESHFGLILVFAIAGLSSLVAGFAAVSWFAWMADLIPSATRGSYFARRTMLAGVAAAVVSFVAGRFVDFWKDRFGAEDPNGFLIVFAIGLLFGVASWVTLVRCPEPPIPEPAEEQRPPFLSMLREVWADENFRRVLYTTSLLSFGVWIASPFFSVYMIKVMHLPYFLMAGFMAASSLGSLVFVRFWGRLTDHFGSHPVMSACINGASLLPALWLLSAGGAWWPILLAHVLGGASWSGYMLAQMNLLFKIVPEERKSVHIGVFYALDALPTLFAPIIGGLLLQHTSHWSWDVGTWKFTTYHFLFLASACTRFAATPLLRRVNEPDAKDVRHMYRALGHFRNLNPVFGLPYYALMVSDMAASGRQKAASAARAVGRRARRLLRPKDDRAEGAD